MAGYPIKTVITLAACSLVSLAIASLALVQGRGDTKQVVEPPVTQPPSPEWVAWSGRIDKAIADINAKRWATVDDATAIMATLDGLRADVAAMQAREASKENAPSKESIASNAALLAEIDKLEKERERLMTQDIPRDEQTLREAVAKSSFPVDQLREMQWHKDWVQRIQSKRDRVKAIESEVFELRKQIAM